MNQNALNRSPDKRAFVIRALWALVVVVTCLSGCSRAGDSDKNSALPASAKPEPAASVEVNQRGVAILAGGCFWGMEEILRSVPGVIDTEVGYTGGNVSSPNYDVVHTGESGHAEAVRVVFDKSKLSYDELLEKWFFRMHDPTTKNRQGNDVGTQYRSAIFVSGPEQRKTAKAVIKRLNASGRFDAPIVTTIEDAGPFTPAEAYHQDYLQKHPGGYTCHYLRDWT